MRVLYNILYSMPHDEKNPNVVYHDQVAAATWDEAVDKAKKQVPQFAYIIGVMGTDPTLNSNT